MQVLGLIRIICMGYPGGTYLGLEYPSDNIAWATSYCNFGITKCRYYYVICGSLVLRNYVSTVVNFYQSTKSISSMLLFGRITTHFTV